MSTVTPTEVRLFLKGYLNGKLEATGRGPCEELPEDCDLLLSGIIDSIGLLELMEALRELSGNDIDFEVLDPEEMTIVGPLCRFVSEQVSKRG
jgi:acyl carrier protein